MRIVGLIRKKSAMRGSEGGVKYVCDDCSCDITATVTTSTHLISVLSVLTIYVQVRIHCCHADCTDFDLCVPCFGSGSKGTKGHHDPRTHPYSVVEQHSIPIYDPSWGADEEIRLLEGQEMYGLGAWPEVTNHVGGYWTREEIRDHYINTYVNTPNFPLPTRAALDDRELADQTPREEFQAKRKRRIEERKEAVKTAELQTPKKLASSSVPACHEISGYMPGRLEFDVEYANDAEETVQFMQFDPGDGRDPNTGELYPEIELQLIVMNIYNARLTQRADRKRVIFEQGLLEYRKNAAIDKKRTKEERELVNKAKPFARMLNRQEFESFTHNLEYEHNLRQAIAQLQEWRGVRIGDLKSGEKYEAEKQTRAARPSAQTSGLGQFDRMPGVKPNKPPPVIETPSQTTALTGADMPDTLKEAMDREEKNIVAKAPPPQQPTVPQTNGRTPLANGNTNLPAPASLTNGISEKPKHHQQQQSRYIVPPIIGVQPLKLTTENTRDLHLLGPEERDLCSTLRILPKPYLSIKEGILKEAMKNGGNLKRKAAREVARVSMHFTSIHFHFWES